MTRRFKIIAVIVGLLMISAYTYLCAYGSKAFGDDDADADYMKASPKKWHIPDRMQMLEMDDPVAGQDISPVLTAELGKRCSDFTANMELWELVNGITKTMVHKAQLDKINDKVARICGPADITEANRRHIVDLENCKYHTPCFGFPVY